MRLNADFSIFITVSIDGNQGINLHFYNAKYKIIGCVIELCNNTTKVTKLIETINDITLNKIPKLEIPSTTQELPAFTLNLKSDYTEFLNEYSGLESVTIKTSDLKIILFELLYFLKKYENNEIPNLIYNLQKE